MHCCHMEKSEPMYEGKEGDKIEVDVNCEIQEDNFRMKNEDIDHLKLGKV